MYYLRTYINYYLRRKRGAPTNIPKECRFSFPYELYDIGVVNKKRLDYYSFNLAYNDA